MHWCYLCVTVSAHCKALWSTMVVFKCAIQINWICLSVCDLSIFLILLFNSYCSSLFAEFVFNKSPPYQCNRLEYSDHTSLAKRHYNKKNIHPFHFNVVKTEAQLRVLSVQWWLEWEVQQRKRVSTNRHTLIHAELVPWNICGMYLKPHICYNEANLWGSRCALRLLSFLFTKHKTGEVKWVRSRFTGWAKPNGYQSSILA